MYIIHIKNNKQEDKTMKRYYVAPLQNKYMMVEVIDNNGASALFAGTSKINKEYKTSFIATDCSLVGWGEAI